MLQGGHGRLRPISFGFGLLPLWWAFFVYSTRLTS